MEKQHICFLLALKRLERTAILSRKQPALLQPAAVTTTVSVRRVQAFKNNENCKDEHIDDCKNRSPSKVLNLHPTTLGGYKPVSGLPS